MYDISDVPAYVFGTYSGDIQSDSVAKGPKLLSIKNYVIEIMT